MEGNLPKKEDLKKTMKVDNTESYAELKHKHSEEMEAFTHKNCIWAFSNEQFQNALDKLGITKEQFQEQYVGFLGGGVIRKDAVDEWKELNKRQTKELHHRMETDHKFAVQAFNYELSNYETFLSYRFEEAFCALGYSGKDVNENEHLLKAYKEAKKIYWDWCIENC